MKKKLTKKQKEIIKNMKKFAKETMDIELDYNKATMFMHCAHCMEEFYRGEFGFQQSPREAMHEELTNYPFTYPDGTTANILVVWCKRCGRPVWDSRHLRHFF